jgi:hypothetical protein
MAKPQLCRMRQTLIGARKNERGLFGRRVSVLFVHSDNLTDEDQQILAAPARRPQSPLGNVLLGLGVKLLQMAGDLMLGLPDARFDEITMNMVEDARLEVCDDILADQGIGVSVGVGAGFAKLLRSPKAKQFVGPGEDLELDFCVVRELAFEDLFTFVESGHGRAFPDRAYRYGQYRNPLGFCLALPSSQVTRGMSLSIQKPLVGPKSLKQVVLGAGTG